MRLRSCGTVTGCKTLAAEGSSTTYCQDNGGQMRTQTVLQQIERRLERIEINGRSTLVQGNSSDG
jgi:hypothetical protein